jgi:hypothetical protein
VASLTCVIFPYGVLILIGYRYSASGARKEKQGEKAKEGSCCVESIPFNTLRTLIARFDKSRNHKGMCALCIHIHMLCQAMSVVMLPRRKHDVQLRDKHIWLLP